MPNSIGTVIDKYTTRLDRIIEQETKTADLNMNPDLLGEFDNNGSIEIPTLVDVMADDEWEGRTAIVDGYTGTLYIDPDEEVLKEYKLRLEADRKEKEALLRFRDETDETADGKKIGLYANIGNMSDLNNVLY